MSRPQAITITSTHNARLADVARLVRRADWRARQRRFVAAGEDLLAAADAAGCRALERYCAAGSGLAGVEVAPALLARACGLASGTRALAVYEQRWLPRATGPLCVHLHGVRDPGNVGAVLRAAHAFGAACVSLGPGSADPHGPRAVRASMGAIFTVGIARAQRLAELPGVKVALAPGRGVALAELGSALSGHAAAGGGEVSLLVGGERAGLDDELLAGADVVAHIPIRGDSLNAAMAAAIALYELQRPGPHGSSTGPSLGLGWRQA
jgi:TrmH family RNA methyltransferase